MAWQLAQLLSPVAIAVTTAGTVDEWQVAQVLLAWMGMRLLPAWQLAPVHDAGTTTGSWSEVWLPAPAPWHAVHARLPDAIAAVTAAFVLA